jgi:O-antigen ligase
MTTSASNVAAVPALRAEPSIEIPKAITRERVARRHTLASRFAFITICTAIVVTTLAYGTVHYWALAIFELSATGLVCFWCVDAFTLRSAQISLNPLQLPLLGMILLGLIQLIPFKSTPASGLLDRATRTLSLDPYSTRLVIIQVASLFIYFVAVLIFTDTSRRQRALVRTIIVFGFFLAMFGLMQSFTSDGTRVYWFRQLTQSTAFGPFINRHHFAGYMELTIGLPLGLLFSGGLEGSKRPMYLFVALLMGVALIATNSRGGMISLGAEILFLAVIAGPGLRRKVNQSRAERARSALFRALLAVVLLVALIGGSVFFGGAASFTRLLGTANSADPTTGRSHFWGVAVEVIKTYPIFGTGLGSFGVMYTRYDSWNGFYRVEQVHNDYLQALSDGGIAGGILGLAFILILFRGGLVRRETEDRFRRGVVTGALTGCFAVLVHSFFDFTLHTTSNALLFLILAALATLDSRVNQGQRRRRSHKLQPSTAEIVDATPAPTEAVTVS